MFSVVIGVVTVEVESKDHFNVNTSLIFIFFFGPKIPTGGNSKGGTKFGMLTLGQLARSMLEPSLTTVLD